MPESATRETPFGYACQGCGHCCHHYLVQLNAYEVDRLEAATGAPAVEFAVRRAGLLVLRQDEGSGRCIFRSEAGCAVHADRPLACRLYPLRRTMADGVERWEVPARHPDSRGVYTDRGSIGDYVVDQDMEPYVRAADEAAR